MAPYLQGTAVFRPDLPSGMDAAASLSFPMAERRRAVTLNEMLRLIAGTFVLISLALGWFVHPAFFLFTAFVGANLVQSAFSHTCPMMWFLRKTGVREG